MVANASVIHVRSYSELTGRGGGEPLYLTYPHKENSKGVKSGERAGEAIVPPRLTGIGLEVD